MTHNLYTIVDTVAEMSGPIFQAVNDGVASRQFRTLLKTEHFGNKEDFILVQIGVYNDNIPEITETLSPVRKIHLAEEVQNA